MPSPPKSLPSTSTVMDSTTLVFNTGASLPYKHESLVVKKRIKVDKEGTWCLPFLTLIQTIWAKTDNNAIGVHLQPYLAAPPTRHSGGHVVPIPGSEQHRQHPNLS
ncbi:hypothetical protein CSKR_106100 [Clonorchis sinensis]|uniref:Uncharacterized protein n=1 Tax=Clonorchis sinensis TaxID=79923 RepID=A0A3R7JZB0_CLOSI|nr:hypothetical protein CSKR_106100 [Clonorchis sinensis]